jgi:hypothetical protein
LPGWLEFNARRTGLTAHRWSSGSADEARADAVLYLDRRGRVKLPPSNPYLPVVFRSPHAAPARRTGDWLRVAAPLVEEMKRRGSANQLYLAPDVDDVRPWVWGGFLVGVRYSYYVDFPFDDALQTKENRRRIRQAEALGLTVVRTDDVDLVHQCLVETEARQSFSSHLGPGDLRIAAGLIGADGLRMYLCLEPGGRPAAACVVLHAPGARAIGWLAGGRIAGIDAGATRILWRFAFDDLAAAGALGLDMSGANIPSVATFKSYWGARLVASTAVRTYSLRTAARFAADWLGAGHEPRHG